MSSAAVKPPSTPLQPQRSTAQSRLGVPWALAGGAARVHPHVPPPPLPLSQLHAQHQPSQNPASLYPSPSVTSTHPQRHCTHRPRPSAPPVAAPARGAPRRAPGLCGGVRPGHASGGAHAALLSAQSPRQPAMVRPGAYSIPSRKFHSDCGAPQGVPCVLPLRQVAGGVPCVLLAVCLVSGWRCAMRVAGGVPDVCMAHGAPCVWLVVCPVCSLLGRWLVVWYHPQCGHCRLLRGAFPPQPRGALPGHTLSPLGPSAAESTRESLLTCQW